MRLWKSRVGGILETGGGVRVVVTQLWRFRFHVWPGERLFVVPGLRVDEPVPFSDIPGLIQTVNDYVRLQLDKEAR